MPLHTILLPVVKRGAEYQRRKQVIADKLFAILYKQFPHLEGKVAHWNIGTPLSNDYYLGSWQVCATQNGESCPHALLCRAGAFNA